MNGVLKPFIITYAIIALLLRFCICDAILDVGTRNFQFFRPTVSNNDLIANPLLPISAHMV